MAENDERDQTNISADHRTDNDLSQGTSTLMDSTQDDGSADGGNSRDISSNVTDTDQSFAYDTSEQGGRLQHRLRMWKSGITIGVMVLGIVLVVAMLAGYGANQSGANSSDDTGSDASVDSSVSDSQTATSGDDDETIPAEAAKFQSQEVVGDGQIPDHYRGSADAKVVAIEYADFNCSHCISLASQLNDIYDQYGDQVQFIYRNYDVGFTYSAVTPKIAEAAYVVGGEDAYWKVHDKLFNDSTWSRGRYMDDDELRDVIIGYGDELGLDGRAIADAYADSANNGIDAKIQRDTELGQQSGVTGTPTWFINGKRASSSADGIRSDLDELLQ